MEEMIKKMREGGVWLDEPRMTECRFVSFLWIVIEEEEIEMRELKEILMVLSGQQNRQALIEEMYGRREGVEGLISAWDQLPAKLTPSRSNTSP